MDNNTIKSQSIQSLYNVDISYNFYDNQVSFKHIELLPVGTLAKPIQVFSSGVITKVKGTTIKPIHQTTVPRGYKNVALKLADGEWSQYGVHRLVFYSYNHLWSDKSQGSVIHHVNGIKYDDRLSNLMITSSSDNVSRFFDGRDNQSEIANQQYKDDVIAKGITSLTYDGEQYPDYYVTRSGEVFHYVEGQRVPVKVYTANKKYPTNRNVKVQGVTMSLTRLVAENFLVTPEGKYKSLLKDNTLDNLYTAKNIYVMPLKKQFN